jgi:hypothetical protein
MRTLVQIATSWGPEPEYSVLIVVDVAPDGLLKQVRVLRIGVGL